MVKLKVEILVSNQEMNVIQTFGTTNDDRVIKKAKIGELIKQYIPRTKTRQGYRCTQQITKQHVLNLTKTKCTDRADVVCVSRNIHRFAKK